MDLQVTIFGQSAGSQAVMFHLMSQKSDPLFQHAIMEAHPAMFKYPNLDEAFEITDRVLNLANCEEENQVQCLR